MVGPFLLSELTHIDVNMGLYRDDGLATSTKKVQASRSDKKRNAQNLQTQQLTNHY